MRDEARSRRSAWHCALAVATLCGACATFKPEVREAARAESQAEQPPAPPPLPEARTPRPVAPSPAAALAVPAAPARSFSELTGGRGGAPAEVLEVVDDLLFAPDSAVLDARSLASLEALAARLRARGGDYRLEIQGHTDGTGSATQNLRVALERAEAVRRHLVRATGIAADRVAIVSLGSAHPAADEATAAGRARNRRAVVLVMR
jgi:outer membrane protein OmpA-like peptidoglycan-associated protein